MFEFEINGQYINRKGEYTVVDIYPPKMLVKYADGSTAELNMAIQARIWENILVEQEAEAAKRSARSSRSSSSKTQHFIKAINLSSPTEMAFAGWAERVIFATPEQAQKIQQGDRIIYYALETQSFIAVATITSPANTADPKDYFYTTDLEEAYFFPVDVDAAANSPEKGVTDDSVEMESQPNFRKMTLAPESYLQITEDDFELLAEILTEIAEEDEDDLDEDEFVEEEED
ncbi:MAG: EVE domain-containing protein [Ardenticatenaceae bacterium]|nr:EVE domain-containing protein [Ardenticatenaceae bacterium]MCB8991932.1 EVE domain-containing protein [Ardenticatenaceae bacterium]MCB9004742.1 EVE domain-containing protein [Ardenticatenaceae bacterium]